MSSPAQRYQKEMYSNLEIHATWLPGDRLRVGDVGTLKGGRFHRRATLAELGIECRVEEATGNQSLQYTSTSGTRVEFDTDANVALGISRRAQVDIGFSQRGAFLFQASGVRHRSIRDRLAFEAAVFAAHRAGEWRKDWVVIDTVYGADCATVIVSKGRDSAISLSLQRPPLHDEGQPSGLPLADPSVALTVSRSRGEILHVVGAIDLTPLFMASRLRGGWLTEPQLAPPRGLPLDETPMTRVSLGELVDESE